MPDRIPPHKECDFLALDSDRIKMCEIVCSEFDKAKVSLEEFERKGKSYSYNTVLSLKNKYREHNFYFVCGGDMIASLDTWYRAKDLVREVKFIAFKRKDYGSFLSDVEKMRNFGADITVIEGDVPSVSSTMFRNSMDKKLLPEKVYDYLKSRNIYNVK